jgi:hypothetical protein
VSLIVSSEANKFEIQVTDQDMLVETADEICKARAAQGKRLNWPPGMTLEKATKPEEYPRDVWAEATRQWNGLSADERARRIDDRKKDMNEFKNALVGAVKQSAFKDSFSPFDILWFLLAVLTSFRLGSGTFSPD